MVLGRADGRQPGRNAESCGLFHTPRQVFLSSEFGARRVATSPEHRPGVNDASACARADVGLCIADWPLVGTGPG